MKARKSHPVPGEMGDGTEVSGQGLAKKLVGAWKLVSTEQRRWAGIFDLR